MSDELRFKYREEWLTELVNILRPHLSSLGYSIPDPAKLRISCGFPSTKALSAKNWVAGECWSYEASPDGSTQILISPRVSDSLTVAAHVVHELGHASGIHGHKGDFKAFMKKLGLIGKATATEAGPELTHFLSVQTEKLGPYPHAGLEALAKTSEKKQTTRMIKAECINPDEHAKPFIVRLSREALGIGYPVCPCGLEMVPDLPDDAESEEGA